MQRAQPMLDYFWPSRIVQPLPGFNYEVQGVYQEREDGRIKFYTYVVREWASREDIKRRMLCKNPRR